MAIAAYITTFFRYFLMELSQMQILLASFMRKIMRNAPSTSNDSRYMIRDVTEFRYRYCRCYRFFWTYSIIFKNLYIIGRNNSKSTFITYFNIFLIFNAQSFLVIFLSWMTKKGEIARNFYVSRFLLSIFVLRISELKLSFFKVLCLYVRIIVLR